MLLLVIFCYLASSTAQAAIPPQAQLRPRTGDTDCDAAPLYCTSLTLNPKPLNPKPWQAEDWEHEAQADDDDMDQGQEEDEKYDDDPALRRALGLVAEGERGEGRGRGGVGRSFLCFP